MRRQIGEALTWLVVALIMGGFALLLASVWSDRAKADGYIYKPKDYTKQQKIHQGKIKKKNLQLVV